MEKYDKRSNRFIGRGIKMIDLKDKLELKDLIRELEENDIEYTIHIDKVLKTGKLVTLDIEVYIWLN